MDLWLTDTRSYDEVALDALRRWLGADELERCQRFVRPQRRRQYILGRVLLRRALADLLAIDAGAIRLQDRPGAAPLLLHPSGAGFFSIAHSGPWVGCAARRDAAIGLDIEVVDAARPVMALAAQAFDAAEVGALGAMPADLRVDAFHAMWCRHEARIKLGADPVAMVDIKHAELAIALCGAAPFDAPPRLRNLTLAADLSG